MGMASGVVLFWTTFPKKTCATLKKIILCPFPSENEELTDTE
jgi:hypothetical protein